MEDVNILVIRHSNTERVEVQTNARLSNNKYSFNEGDLIGGVQVPGYDAFKAKLLAIPGIDQVHIGRHNVNLERFEVFPWEPIIDAVVEQVALFAAPKINVKVDDRRDTIDRVPDSVDLNAWDLDYYPEFQFGH